MADSMLDVEWEAALLQPARDPEIERYARRSFGGIPPSVRYLLPCRWLVYALIDLNPDRGMLLHLDLELARLASMAVSRDNACRYCYATSRALMRIRGSSEEELHQLEQQLSGARRGTPTDAALEFARRLSRSDPLVGAADRQRLAAAGFSPGAIKDLAFVVVYTVLANRAATLAAIPPYSLETLPDRWPQRLLRPLIALRLNSLVRRGQPQPTPEPATNAPYADLVQAYGGSPIAPALSRSLQQAWASPGLTRRCKALLFAVVAHGLGCPYSEREARLVLAEEAFPGDRVDAALHHLHAAELTPAETVLVPFARETLWYAPAPLQRQARAVRDALGLAQFLEALGVLSLANALCRLSTAVVGTA